MTYLQRIHISLSGATENLSPRSRSIATYLATLFTALTGGVMDFQLHTHITTSPFLFSYLTVIISTSIGGMPTGSLATILIASGMLLARFLTTTSTTFPLPLLFETFVFLLSGLVSSYIIELFRDSDIRAEHHKKELAYRHSVEKLEKDLLTAKQEIKSRDEFLSIASHELKTPLTSMLLGIQSLLHSIRNVSLANFSVANLLEKLESTEQQSKRLSRMINDLLNLSLITTGRMELQPEEIDLTDLTEQTVQRLSEKLKKDHCDVKLKTHGPIKGKWDKIRLEQVITNLLTNAAKYGNKKPVTVTVNKSKTQASITVEDQGIGIPFEQQKKIFQRFTRADGSARSFEGLGVGLYISKLVVDAHKGSIAVSSKPGKGSIFHITLPL